MIEKMTRYNFILLGGEEEKFLADLQELGVVDITRSFKPVDDASNQLLLKAESLKNAVAFLGSQDFPDITPLPVSAEDPAAETALLQRRLQDVRFKLEAARKEYFLRKPWGDFNQTDFDELEKRGYKTRWYCVSKKIFNEAWEDLVPLKVIREEDNSVWFVTVSDDPDYIFPVQDIPAPGGDYTLSEEQIQQCEEELVEIKGHILGLKENIPEIEQQSAQLLNDLDMYLAGKGSESAVEGYVTLFEGFAPVEEDQRLAEAFDNMDALWYKSEAKLEDNPPIKLKGNWFTRMFSVLTDMYGRPQYNGFDPTPYISVFFLLFFAFCMGDAGYGLVLILVGFLLKKVKSFANLAPLVVTLGVGTTVIGLIFHTFFSMDMLTWSCIPDGVKKFMLPSKIAGYDGTMVLALVVGIVHLSIAMVVKAIYATKNEGIAKTVGTWGWTLLIVGGAIVGGIALAGVLDKEVTKWVLIGLGVLSALAIFPLNNLKRNPLVNTGLGLWDTYQTVTGLLGDVLSYLRLYALGLAGAMLGYAFNSIGQMALGDGSSIGGWIGFILIVLIGHTLNLAMCALGAFVHPLRLNFLEFFKNSGYETSPRNYTPLQKTNNNQ
ncbi:MAG: ATPase V [Bacteroidales bacterium]|nr:ATPase V [Bacteroidales bacterium]